MSIFNLESEVHLTPCRKNLFAIIALFIIVLSTYSNTFHASWQFDDTPNILQQKSLQLNELTWENLKNTFLLREGGNWRVYRPAARLSFVLNYYFGKEDVFGYHLVNISIHFLASLFLFLFIHNTLNLPMLKTKYGPNSYFIALLASILWAVNPIHTQAVTYIVQRMASMAGMFYIMSMFFYLKGRISEKRLPKMIYYALFSIAAVLAFASKENAAMLPISLLLFDLFLIQGITKESLKKSSLVLLAMLIIPACLAFLLAGPLVLSPKELFSGYEDRAYSLLERLLTQPRIILFYITLILYPMPNRLNILHETPISHGLFDPTTTILSILVILLIVSIAVIKARRWPLMSFCVVFFFLNHIVESTLFPLELVFEHRNYIPSMLFFVPIAIFIGRGIRFFSYKRSMQAIVSFAVVLTLVALGHSTFMRNFTWKTEETLWLDTIEKSPNLPRPHHNLGKYYGTLGHREKEIAEYELALKLGPGPHGERRYITHYNLGLAYYAQSEKDKALEHLKKAIELEGRFSDAYNNIAVIMIEKRRYDEAFDYLIKALTYDYKHFGAHLNLGIVMLKKGRLEAALSEFRKALAIKKDVPSALFGLGVTYKNKKDFIRAKYYLQKALEHNNKNIMYRLHLIETLFLMEDREPLEQVISEGLSIIPAKEMNAVIENIEAEGFPDIESPDLQIILPLLGKAYMERSSTLRKYALRYLEKRKGSGVGRH